MKSKLFLNRECKIILASSSSIRAQLIKNAGINITIEKANIDEREIESGFITMNCDKIAEKLAEEKSREVSCRFPDALVIGCDQILSFEQKLFHKAKTIEEAYQNLLVFSGKTHQLHSAVALFKNGEKKWTYCDTAYLTVRKLTDEYIQTYLASIGDDCLSTVGSYQIEGKGIQLFQEIKGDYFTIMGLPLLPLLSQLRKMGVIYG